LNVVAPAAAQTSLPAANPEPTAPAPERSTDSFTDLIRDSLGDFRRLPSAETAAWLGVGAMGALLGSRADRSVDARLSAPSLDAPFDAGDIMGTGQIQIGGAFATYTLGRITGNRRVTAVGADLVRAQMITKAMTVGLKVAAHRTRPDGTAWSFPSGHTSAGFATATVLQRNFGWKVGVPAYGVASYIAASRLNERKHFLSDVAFGAAIGIVAGRTVTVGRGNGRVAIAPVAAPGGAGVAFTWVGR
jgi:membrane-associated phospholipid phosphatase